MLGRITERCRGARLPLAVAIVIVAGAPVPAHPQEAGNLGEMRQRALELVNQARADNDLPALEFGETLNEAAQAHAEDMLARDYYGHVSPEGETVMDRYQEAGGDRWRLVLENIARCQGCPTPPTTDRVERFQQGWMESPGHRANILSRGLENFGFGIAGGDGQVYAVQTFAGPGLPRGLEEGEEPEPLSADEQISLALRVINREREAQGALPLDAAEALTSAAENLLAQMQMEPGTLSLPQDVGLMEALPEGARRDWSQVAMIAGGCGGCGTDETAADVRFFANQWLDNPQYRSRLLDSGLTHLGFALAAGGEGRKTALAVIGAMR